MGRSRKIENEGFNNQKNLRYNIEYANSLDYTTMKNHYVLTQIADIIMQLFMKGLKIFKVVKKTAREISLAREAIRNIILTTRIYLFGKINASKVYLMIFFRKDVVPEKTPFGY